jgi:hypothetical protein
MARFSGRQYEGASRVAREVRRNEAEARQQRFDAEVSNLVRTTGLTRSEVRRYVIERNHQTHLNRVTR